MSLKKWRELAAGEADLEQQEREIRQEFKKHKIAEAMGEATAEKLFKPITKRLDKTLPSRSLK